jgi:hypothetical protein
VTQGGSRNPAGLEVVQRERDLDFCVFIGRSVCAVVSNDPSDRRYGGEIEAACVLCMYLSAYAISALRGAGGRGSGVGTGQGGGLLVDGTGSVRRLRVA